MVQVVHALSMMRHREAPGPSEVSSELIAAGGGSRYSSDG